MAQRAMTIGKCTLRPRNTAGPSPVPGRLDRFCRDERGILPGEDSATPPRPRVRDADRTKARIFEAAVEQFAAYGFDGARIDKIAERAGVNKRMIYFYWGHKQELYREILRQKVQAMHEIFTTEWGPPAENLVRYFTGTLAETELLRFIQWEALGDTGSSLVAEDERRDTFKLNVRALQHDQRQGNLTAEIPADLLMLIFMALSSFPVAFSQNVRLVTGRSWDDPQFQERWSAALGVVARLLGGDAGDGAAVEPAAEAVPEPASTTRPRSGRARRGSG
jgi:TetR/AcrR family transcriptional regulator